MAPSRLDGTLDERASHATVTTLPELERRLIGPRAREVQGEARTLVETRRGLEVRGCVLVAAEHGGQPPEWAIDEAVAGDLRARRPALEGSEQLVEGAR